MIIIFTISYILLVSTSASDARSCKTPADEKGACMSIYDCKDKNFLETIEKKNRAAQDDKFLRDLQCGYKDGTVMVCCPYTKECVTPDGKQGQCVGLYYCAHIAYMVLDSSLKDNMDYVNKSACNGPEQHSVCCGPPPDIQPEKMTPNERCTRLLTAFPPESDSKCCGLESSAGNKIIGGTATKIDEYPWLVVIEYVKLGVIRLLCGGSLISSKYVLTAGHCVAGDILYDGTPKNVRLGEYNTTNNGPDCVQVEAGGLDCTHPVVIVPIEKTIPHPDYNSYDQHKRHDIALIRLKIGALYTDFMRPICLPSMDYRKTPPEDFQFFVAGWGRYKQFANGTRLSSKVKQHVMVPYVKSDKCEVFQRKLHGGEKLVLESGQICAGGEAGKDSCKGDSGGPLMYNNEKTFEIIGVVSFGAEECGTFNIPGVYTYVYEYLPWIKSTIQT